MTLLTPSDISFFQQWWSIFDPKFFAVAIPLALIAAFVFRREP